MQIPPPVHVWSKTSIYSFMVMKYVELEDVSFFAKDQGFVFCPATTRNPYIVLFGFVTVAGVMGNPTLGIKGALNGYQRIAISTGQAIEITSQKVYTPLGINVYGIASGIRASYNVLYTEYNSDGGQTPAVLKLGMSWANPANFYFKRTSNANSLVIEAHNNGTLIVDISGGTSNTLIIKNISDVSGYTTIKPVVYNFGCNSLEELAASLKPLM